MTRLLDHSLEVCDLPVEAAPKVARGGLAFNEACLDLELSGRLHAFSVNPSDRLITPEQRQRIVTKFSFGRRRIGLKTEGPSPEMLESSAIPNDGIERRQEPDTA